MEQDAITTLHNLHSDLRIYRYAESYREVIHKDNLKKIIILVVNTHLNGMGYQIIKVIWKNPKVLY